MRSPAQALSATLIIMAVSATILVGVGSGIGHLASPASTHQAALSGPHDSNELLAQLEHSIRTTPYRTVAGTVALQNASWLAYDSADASFYIAVPPSSVDVVPYNGSGTFSATAAIRVGSDPFGVAVDNRSGDVFVTNNGSGNLSVISNSAPITVASVPVGSNPSGVAYDWVDDLVFVANTGSNNVTVISGSSLAVLESIPVGTAPLGVAYDSVTGKVFVADSGSNQLTIIRAGTGAVLGTVRVGLEPYGVALDTAADTVYVTDQASNNISVVGASNDTPFAAVPVYDLNYPSTAHLQGIAFDAKDGYLWAGAGARYAIVIDPLNESVLAYLGIDPSGAAYDPDAGAVCLTSAANTTLECLPATANLAGTESTLTFSETGLPAGTEWNVTIGRETSATTSSTQLLFGVPFESEISYNVWPAPGFAASPSSGVVRLSASPLDVPVSFVRATGPYSVDFSETGLPAGTSWSVNLGGSSVTSTSDTITFSLSSGNYSYKIALVPGWIETSEPATGTVEVNGASVVVPPFQFGPYLYPVQFTETGLNRTSCWSITLGGASQTSCGPGLTFWEGNGSYGFVPGNVTWSGNTSLFKLPSAGFVHVDGANVTVPLQYFRSYPVTFGEVGLPPTTVWSVTFAGVTASSGSSEIQFDAPNGTFLFGVGFEPAYSATPSSGPVVVAGGPSTVGVTFAPIPTGVYPVEFIESGLVDGIGWSVMVTNQSLGIHETQEAVAPNALTFYLPNGTYVWGVYVPAGYSSGIPSGPLVVNGGPTQPASVAFAPSSASSPVGTPTWAPWVVGVVGAAVGIAGLGFAYTQFRRRPPRTK